MGSATAAEEGRREVQEQELPQVRGRSLLWSSSCHLDVIMSSPYIIVLILIILKSTTLIKILASVKAAY